MEGANDINVIWRDFGLMKSQRSEGSGQRTARGKLIALS
jgi:hypothetical protein